MSYNMLFHELHMFGSNTPICAGAVRGAAAVLRGLLRVPPGEQVVRICFITCYSTDKIT
jgi:hypothetical protein